MKPPNISSLSPDSAKRPFWAVMIPTYNPRADHLAQTLRSVLSQDPGADRMQIQVVDDCSTSVDVAAMVRSIVGDRVAFSANSKNLGLAGCWNACIEQSRGHWVHILHQDDYVLPGFYDRLGEVVQSHPEMSLIAARTFFVDDEGFITGVTARLLSLEGGGHEVGDFFYGTPIQCPGVVVRREFYERHGGFRSDLPLTLDCEMWARVIGLCDGVVMPDVLAAYRISAGNESSRLARSGEALTDLRRLNGIFADMYSNFDLVKGNRRVCDLARTQAEWFDQKGDSDAAAVHRRYWRKNASAARQIRHFLGNVLRKLSG